jgi:hypothetical protein
MFGVAGAAAGLQAAGLIPGIVAGTLIAGALGSVVSVLVRMTRGRLQLDYEAGKSVLRLLGAVRPFVGAVFASALILLVEGGLLPLKIPDESTQRTAFALGLAFLAGFSERWAQDMLAVSRDTLSASSPPI